MSQEVPDFDWLGIVEIRHHHPQEFIDQLEKDAKTTVDAFFNIIQAALETQKSEEARYWLKKFVDLNDEDQVVLRIGHTSEIGLKLARAILLKSKDDSEAAVEIVLNSELDVALELQSKEVTNTLREVLQAISNFHFLRNFAEKKGMRILTPAEFLSRDDRDQFTVLVMREE